MTSPARRAPLADRLRSALPPLLVLAGAVGYLGVDPWVGGLHPVPGQIPAWVHAGLVVLQAVAMLQRVRYPVAVFAVVVALDLVILGTTSGELGIGSLGVILATYALARRRERRTVVTALVVGAAATTMVGGIAMVLGSSEQPLVLVFAVVARIALQYVLPAGVAEYARGRERLLSAIEDQARMAENERRISAQNDLRAERTALARELHDIAGHHLSGIIVSAQAASALVERDPERARAMLQTVQSDARTTLVDLRRTVGLLRSDDADVQRGGDGSTLGPATTPTISAIPELVEAARSRGQHVAYTVTGEPRVLGPLAETAAYRTVQESLANAARHAPGAVCRVAVRFEVDAIELTVTNAASSQRPASPSRDGYGLWGMRERAELIGARLTSAPTDEGGWRNRLTIPDEHRPDEHRPEEHRPDQHRSDS
ncbi:sensor histidine kinase [Plantibacter flavus]|uniref:sensor histidine kinase n=1 Tax=Plantibacter flavus TaxID=150123 RepID=UPI001430492C|nr:histidine kinase [Plantibacter flavus]